MRPIADIITSITDKDDMQQISDAWIEIRKNANSYGLESIREAWEILSEMAKNAMNKCPHQFFRKYEQSCI